MTADDLAEKVAAVLHPWLDGTPNCPYRPVSLCHNVRRSHGAAAALLPLIREREAAAWERALREAADGYLDCGCGHEIEWHHEERGCQYLGNGERRCPCLRDAHTAVSDRLRDRAAANPYAGSEGAE